MRFYPLFFPGLSRPLFISSATVTESSARSPPASGKVAKERMNESAWEQLMSFVVTKLTAEDVRKAIELFWSTFLAKSEEELNDFYAPGSTVFQIAMGRSEPGRLGAMRRSREYFGPDTRMELKLSPIDVVM